jgi:hypothetical protein
MSEHEIQVRDLIQLIVVEGAAEKRGILAQELERLLNGKRNARDFDCTEAGPGWNFGKKYTL